MWPEYLNSLACGILLACMLPVASLVEPRRHLKWVLLMLVVEFAFFLQIVSPWVDWMPMVYWPTAALHTMQAACILALRHRFLLFVRIQFEAPPPTHPTRRATDVLGQGA